MKNQKNTIADKILNDVGRHKCSKCKEMFNRIDLWRNPENTKEYTCRNCRTENRLESQKSFESDLRHFRKRQDYVSQEDSFQTNPSRISDKEFDELIQEFEQAHWSEISPHESQKHKKYIESLFRREFQHRKSSKYKKREQNKQQISFEELDLTIHYNLLEVSEKASDKEIKDEYRRLVLKWHPDKTLMNQNTLKKCLFQLKLHLRQL